MNRGLLAYCAPQSVVAGAPVRLHASASAAGTITVTVTVTRVGAERSVAGRVESVAVEHHPTPPDVAAAGCRWPVSVELATEPGWTHGLVARDPDVETITRNVLDTLG